MGSYVRPGHKRQQDGCKNEEHVGIFFFLPEHNRTSDFMYAAAPLAALMMTYGTRSPRLGALPASLFLILERIFVESPHHDNNGFKRVVREKKPKKTLPLSQLHVSLFAGVLLSGAR